MASCQCIFYIIFDISVVKDFFVIVLIIVLQSRYILLTLQLTEAVGKVKVQKTQFDYYNYQPKDPDLDDECKYKKELPELPVEHRRHKSRRQNKSNVISFTNFSVRSPYRNLRFSK